MPTEEDLEFEKELILFKQRLEASSMLNLIKKQIQKEKLRQKRVEMEEEAQDLTKVSASKKRKIKKKAK